MLSNFKTRFAWFIYAFVKIHGFTLLRSSEDKRAESLGSGFKTSSNSRVSSTSRLYAIASKINSRYYKMNYQSRDDEQDPLRQGHMICSIHDEVCWLLHQRF